MIYIKEILIENYINSLKIDDLKNYAKNNNIYLNEKDAIVILDMAKKYWKIVYKGNPNEVFKLLKEKIDIKTYEKLIELYNLYKKEMN